MNDAQQQPVLPVEQVLPLLRALPDWGNLVTIIFAGGSVFEFKGPFPHGSPGQAFYNLQGPVPGLHGHLLLANLVRVRCQDKPHRGRASYAFVFEDADGHVVFKVFLGRDEKGEVFPDQLDRFNRIRQMRDVQSITDDNPEVA